ncbi:ATP-binding protein [Chamaesiphon sp. VAR_48_metabat_135_sub]|uniref:ATP-binding protein n=1 Tax=Chamaesiphon sp. VAR_48_metabat_135_sub TaxID=2964699 RepID=UPI00286B30F3|nr:ATP-binding protein [Chamaesiphon sp. VAR_48_metabat_135_sub]
MANKKSNPNQIELNLCPDGVENLISSNSDLQEILIVKDEYQDNSVSEKKEKIKNTLSNKDNICQTPSININDGLDLFLPLTYEELLQEIGEGKSRLPDLIVPVTEFEEQIVQVLADIKNAGYLLFLYGVSGVGKSTFVSSLQFQKYIPIQQILPIDAGELVQTDDSSKLKELIKAIKQEAIQFLSNNNAANDKLCIVIDYLENLEDESDNDVIAFFRDLNSLLRKWPILIIWPVTVMKDLDSMQSFAKSYSSTMFHRRIPVIKFTGPPIEEYPNIAKKTIMFFNKGKSCYDFQLNDNDFEELKNNYQQKPQEKHLIRDYLTSVRNLWETRTNYISKIVKSIPKPTEVWFIFSYPDAEGTVARFAKQTPDIINEMWNADYKSLSVYITDNNQKKLTGQLNVFRWHLVVGC